LILAITYLHRQVTNLLRISYFVLCHTLSLECRKAGKRLVNFDDLAIQFKKQRMENQAVILDPSARSEWVKELWRVRRLELNMNMFEEFIDAIPPVEVPTDHEIFGKFQVTEEPKDKNVKGTRAYFGEIIGKWVLPAVVTDTASRNTPTVGTHKPGVLHRLKYQGGEQSIVALGDVKLMPAKVTVAEAFPDFGDEDCGQILGFLQTGLQVQPWRTIMYGHLNDCRRFQFFKATRNRDGGINFQKSRLYIDATGWRMLYVLLMQSLEKLGFEDVGVQGWAVNGILGAGATSAVFAAKHVSNDGLTAVCKIYLHHDGEQLRAREVRALSALVGHPHVPQVVPGSPDRTASGRFILLKTPVGLALQTTVRLSIAYYAPIVDALTQAHAANVFHNDVAPANLCAVRGDDGSYRVLLNDFGSATTEEELANVRSAGEKIATRVLFYGDATDSLTFGRAADLRALVRSVFFLTQCTFDPTVVTTAAALERVMLEQLPVWREALRLAGIADYNGLTTLLQTGQAAAVVV
jgi:hypothetical protein